MSVQFFQTRMGKTFYEHTLPELVKQLERLNELLARVVDQQDRRDDEEGR